MPPAPTLPGVGQDRREGGGRPEGALTLRVVTSIRTVLDYDRGRGHRAKSWMKPFPLLDGSCCKPLIVSKQVPGGLSWHCGSTSSYIFRQWTTP